MKIWYAVEQDANDNDWGTGSYEYAEAVEIAKRYGKEARIAVISDNDSPECIKIISAEEF